MNSGNAGGGGAAQRAEKNTKHLGQEQRDALDKGRTNEKKHEQRKRWTGRSSAKRWKTKTKNAGGGRHNAQKKR